MARQRTSFFRLHRVMLVLALTCGCAAAARGRPADQVEELSRLFPLPDLPRPGWQIIVARGHSRCLVARTMLAGGASREEVARRLKVGVDEFPPVPFAMALFRHDLGRAQAPPVPSQRAATTTAVTASQGSGGRSGQVDLDDLAARIGLALHYLLLVEGLSAEELARRVNPEHVRWFRRLLELRQAILTRDEQTAVPLYDVLMRHLCKILVQAMREPATRRWGSPRPPSTQRLPAAVRPGATPGQTVPSATSSGPAELTSRASPVPPTTATSEAPTTASPGPWLLLALAVAVAVAGGAGACWTAMRTRGPGGASTLQRAESLLAAGRESEALPLFQRALNSCPGLADDIRCHVVRCLIRQGQIELAMQAHQELDATRAGPRPLYLMARDLEERGQNEVALAAYARLYLIASDFEDVRNRYEKMKQLTCPSRSAESLKELLARIPARYTGVERIGEGGMGVVLKAFDTQLEHPVAIKVMSVRASRDTLSIRRFQREIRALTLLSHPNIVKVFDCATAPIHYYTMECLDAPSLRQILARGPMELSRVLEIASRIAAALDHAHRHGIVHRDVKPANVLVAEGDAVKVVDFGLAYMADTTALTRSGHAPGTILYMAPEQLRGEKASPASDIYALGLVMIEMVTGLCPFAGLEPAQRLDSAPPPLPPHPRLGSELSALVMACTAVAPGERPDAGSLAARLAGLGARL